MTNRRRISAELARSFVIDALLFWRGEWLDFGRIKDHARRDSGLTNHHVTEPLMKALKYLESTGAIEWRNGERFEEWRVAR